MQFILQSIILFITLYLAFVKSYLTEKGKSAALKEDIAGLTLEVEKIKHEFSSEQEILKAELQRNLNNNISHKTEARNALISFYSTISEWLYSILGISFSTYNKTNVDLLIELRQKNESFFAKSGILKSKVALIVDEEELVDLCRSLYVETLKFHYWASKEIFNLIQNLESQKSVTDRFMIFVKNFEQNRELAKEAAKEEEIYLKEMKELQKFYYENRNKEYEKIKPLEEEFQKKVKEYLKK